MTEKSQADSEKKKQDLLKLVPEDASRVGNGALIKRSRLPKEDYWTLRNQLIDEGKLGVGRGRGGSVYRVRLEMENGGVASATKHAMTGRGAETKIYPQFERWLRDFWVKDENLTWDCVEKTAQAGRKPTGGPWTRPDFAVVCIRSYKFQQKTLEVVSFEVKPNVQEGLHGVFEAAAHSVFAHRSYLAIQVVGVSDTESKEYERIEKECVRFGIGLITFTDAAEDDTYEIKVDADLKSPLPDEVENFITIQIKAENQESLLRQLR
jgi:hypothetical protein